MQVGTWPRFVMPHREGKDTQTDNKETRELNKAWKLDYISTGEVKFLTHSFSVTKVEYIHMVYIGASSGLNDSLPAPQCSLPTVQTTLMETEEVTYMADKDIGKMFLDFMLRNEVRPYFGVDIRNAWTEEVWERFRLGV